jgi:hypothetical protein
MGVAANSETLTFEALHHADRLHIVNPAGDVGLITLWSPFRTAERKLQADAPELLAPDSRVAVIANLYGDGMYAMFCNLLYNPQIRHLVAIGEDLGLPTVPEIEAFLRDGLEATTVLGQPVARVIGTTRMFPLDPAFDAETLRRRLSFRAFGKLSAAGVGDAVTLHIGTLAADATTDRRVTVDLEPAREDAPTRAPSHVGAHQVVRRSPLDCWEELVVRCVRFGRPVDLLDGRRLELLNAKVVITDPAPDPDAALEAFGFSPLALSQYATRMLDPAVPADVSYTYGSRLQARGALEAVIARLRADPDTRRAYVSLWDSAVDLAPDVEGVPCLVSLFFRQSEERLSLTATYRSHNLLHAWLPNVYGLMGVQRHVAAAVGMAIGEITVFSQSLGINPDNSRFAIAQSIADRWKRDDDVDRASGKFSLREDPNGYFVVSPDHERGLIVAEHRYGGVLIKRYEAERAVTIENEVAADMAITLVSHAMWLGRELTRSEAAIRARG